MWQTPGPQRAVPRIPIDRFWDRVIWHYPTRYTPHRRPWHFGHFLQLALTFVHQHFLQGTSAYLRFVPFFQCFRRRCSAVKDWVGDMGPWCCRQAHWNTSSETIGERTLWPSFFCVALIWAGSHSNFEERHALSFIWVPARQGRVEAFWAVLRVNCLRWWHTASTSNFFATHAPPHPSPCPTSWQLRNINNVCNVQGTLTCPTPPQPLPHILAGAEHQQRVQRTRNVNMPHPTPAPAPHPGRCGTSTTCATYKER